MNSNKNGFIKDVENPPTVENYRGCATRYEPPIENELAKVAINKMKMEDLPLERIAIMQNYAKELRRKFPHMKPQRIQRKVADHFKIKLL